MTRVGLVARSESEGRNAVHLNLHGQNLSVPDLRECIGVICDNKRNPVATGFFVALRGDTGQPVPRYLVTAKHVWRDHFQQGKHGFVRLNSHADGHGQPGVVHRRLEGQWLFHPDKAVDLAVLPWESLDTDLPATPFDLGIEGTEPTALKSVRLAAEFEESPEADWALVPAEGDDVLIIAVVLQYAGRDRNYPVVRQGHIALVTQELVQGEFGPSRYHFIESQLYRGNSGAPVWVVEAGSLFFLGMVASGLPAVAEELVEREKPWRNVKYFNLGISLIVPSESLQELLRANRR